MPPSGRTVSRGSYLADPRDRRAGRRYPASIHDYYMAAGRGEVSHVTVPACNIRGMTYDSSRAARRAAQSLDAKALIYENCPLRTRL